MGFKWPTWNERSVIICIKLEGKKAIFKDGYTIRMSDAIILCTGYLTSFSFLEDRFKIKNSQ